MGKEASYLLRSLQAADMLTCACCVSAACGMQHRLVVLCKIVRTAILGLSEPSALDQASLPKGLLSFFKPSRASVISHADAAARGSRGSVHVAQNRDSRVSGYLLAPAKRSAAPSASYALSIISELETLLSRNYSLLPRLQQLQRSELQSVSIVA